MRLGVVIPTLNEADRIGGAIDLVRARAAGREPEILVVDSGSRDDTVRVALLGRARVHVDAGLASRAAALNAGAARVEAEALLFLHADSRVPDRYDALIEEVLAAPGAVGGAFEFALDGPELGLRLVEWIDRVRYRLRGRYYGDQGIFATRAAFDRAGGFPPLSILEDAHFCARLRRLGAVRLVPVPMLTSPRRFYEGGILTTLAADAAIVAADLIGLGLERAGAWYRAHNVRRCDPAFGGSGGRA